MSGMAKNNVNYVLIEGFPTQENITILSNLYQSIFEDAQLDFFVKRLQEKENIVSVIAFENQQPVGFKIGYTYNETTFYSWVGGVLPTFRRKGIAKKLAELQEDWVKKHRYKTLRTKSMNRFKPMLILNLKNGFDIKQVYTNDSGQTKIIFEKNL